MKLGIFLGYGPRQLDPSQGISRLVAFILKGAVTSDDIDVTVAGAGWIKDDIDALLLEVGLERENIEIITTKGEPLVFKLADKFRRRKTGRRSSRLGQLIERSVRYGAIASSVLIASRSTAFLILAVVLLVLLGSFVSVVGGVMAALLLLLGLASKVIIRSGRAALRVSKFRSLIGKLRRAARNGLLSASVPDRVRERELERLVSLVNQRTDITAWFVPSMFWPEVGKLSGKVVMGAPDIVFYEFPIQFRDNGGRRALSRITRSIAVADHLICYSEHVRQNHLIAKHKIDPSRVSVIRHGNVDMVGKDGPVSRAEALANLHAHLEKNSQSLPDYLRGFRFDDVNFIFYSSQARPYKNIEGLVTVFEKILREDFRPIKLVLTGNIAANERLLTLVNKRNLQRDVISLHAVPNSVLSSLYQLAALSVNPSQFEGGFPFTFSEAYSVGTPSVMSRIPVVLETITDPLQLERMTFAPDDRDEMRQKIVWALDNRDALFDLQRPLFEGLSKRTWSEVADEYLDVIKSVSQRTAASKETR